MMDCTSDLLCLLGLHAEHAVKPILVKHESGLRNEFFQLLQS